LDRKVIARAESAVTNMNFMAKSDLSSQELFLVQSEVAKYRKDGTTAVLLALFLGGLGAHKFYLGQIGLGVLYLVFCWTFIPAIISLIECFMISGYVTAMNDEIEARVINQVLMMRTA
jgi:TM2 domain-containing membrane protein YozV